MTHIAFTSLFSTQCLIFNLKTGELLLNEIARYEKLERDHGVFVEVPAVTILNNRTAFAKRIEVSE